MRVRGVAFRMKSAANTEDRSSNSAGPSDGSLAALAAGVSHEINNLLTALMGHMAIVRADAPPSTPLAASFFSMDQAIGAIASISRQLRLLADKTEHMAIKDQPAAIETVLHEIHGIRATLLSEPPPAMEHAAGSPSAPATPSHGWQRARVFVADTLVRRLIVSVLRDQAIEIEREATYDGLHAFLKQPSEPDRLLIIDLDGIDAEQRYYCAEQLCRSPMARVIAITSDDGVADTLARCASCRVVRKPFKVAGLLECIV